MLIDRKELKQSEETLWLPVLSMQSENNFLTGNSVQVIRQLIYLVKDHPHIHFISSGTFSLHQLITGLIKQLQSPAEVRISTWAISEDPMRHLAELKFSGKISKLEMLLDEKLQQRQGTPFQLLQGIADRITLKKCHAKMVVIKTKECSLVVNGSMNWTRNPRIESGFVSTIDSVVSFYDNFFTENL